MTEAIGTEPVVKEIHIDAKPETVFAFFVEPDKMTRWLCREATVDPRPGGINHQTHPVGYEHADRDYYMRGEFVEVSPPSRVVFTWGFVDSPTPPGSSTVEVTLEPDGDGTLLRFVHRDVHESERADYEKGWTRPLGRLADVAVR
jgi:uncharacterized protein YndB with AHSA1/START domain